MGAFSLLPPRVTRRIVGVVLTMATFLVNAGPTTTTLTASPNPAYINQEVTLTATVNGSNPTGSVTFKDGSVPLITIGMTGNKATWKGGFGALGPHTVTATYSGDASNQESQSTPLSLQIKPKLDSTTTVSVSPTTAVTGDMLTISVTVTGESPGGPVDILVGGHQFGGPTVVNGFASMQVSAFAGELQIVAYYRGDYRHTDSVGSTSVSVAKAGTSTMLSTLPAGTAYVDQAVSLQARLNVESGVGPVQFFDGSTLIGSGQFVSGQGGSTATSTASFPAVGTRSLTAVYGGDSNYNGSTSAPLSLQIVPKLSSTTSLAISSNPANLQRDVTLTATVTGTNPGGSVSFFDGGAPLGSAIVSGGAAAFTTKFSTEGQHSLTATYAGDFAHVPSGSTALNVQVVKNQPAVSMSASPQTVYQGQQTLVRATIDGAIPTGTVAFSEGATPLGTINVVDSKADLTLAFATVGSRAISAQYSGDINNLPANASLAVQTLAGPVPPVSAAPATKLEYDPNGNSTRTTVAPSVPGYEAPTSSTYDGLDRRKDSTDARNGVTRWAYTGRDQVTQVLDPRQLPTKYPRDGHGNAKQLESPDTGTALLTYDAAGNLKTSTDSRGVLATRGYDALNRLTSIVYSQSGQTSVTYGWAYDEVSGTILNGIGRLTSTTFPDGSSKHSYDAQGRLKTFTQTVNAKSGANLAARTHVVTYGYDANGNIQEIVYPSGRKLSISYANGLPTSIALANNVSASPTPLVSGIVFEPFGAVKQWNWELSGGTQRIHERHYDEFGRIIRYTVGGHLRDVRYDAADRISSYTHYGAVDGTPAPTLDQTFDYDELGRLKSIATAASSWGITYDANGNRQSVTLNGTSRTYTTAETSNRLSRLNNPLKLFGYDATGNQTSGGFVATYGLNGRMATLASGGVTATYSINGSGQRIRKFDSTGGASTVIFVYDQAGHLLGEYDRSGVALREYIWLGDELVAIFTPAPNLPSQAVAYYVHTDHLGAPRAVLNRNDQLRWLWLAEPFGTTTPDKNPSGLGEFVLNLRLPGQYFDAESGLHYNHHRDYDPSIGRFVQSDPIGLAGGINTYSYVESQPTKYSDPTGLYIPGVHNSLAYTQAQGTCLEKRATELGNMTGGVDSEPGSQLPENSHGHAMCAAGADKRGCRIRFEQYVFAELSRCDLKGLAHALHAVQDSFAPGHVGFHSWKGMPGQPDGESWLAASWHGLRDLFPFTSEPAKMTKALINEWCSRCGDCK